MKRIFLFCLASIVYHEEFLRENLNENHPLFQTALFRQKLVADLKDHVSCRISRSDDQSQATGVPPHISLLIQMKKLNENNDLVIPEIRKVSGEVIRGVVQELEERAIGARTVTRDGLEELLTGVLESAGLLRLASGLDNPVSRDNVTVSEAQSRFGMFQYDSSFHRVPRDFKFPDGTVIVAWQCWFCGNPEKQIGPYRLFQPKDMPSPLLRKTFSDYKYLMKKIEIVVRDKNEWVDRPTIEDVNRMLEIGKDALYLEPKSEKNRTRRPGQIKWRTMTKLVRKMNKTSENMLKIMYLLIMIVSLNV